MRTSAEAASNSCDNVAMMRWACTSRGSAAKWTEPLRYREMYEELIERLNGYVAAGA